LNFFWRCRCFKAATFFFLYMSIAQSLCRGTYSSILRAVQRMR
jgi:hypothetical protein